MDQSSILTEIYQSAARESLASSQIYDLELALNSAQLLAGRFDFEAAASILIDTLTALQVLPLSSISLRLQARCLTELGNIRRDQGRIHGVGGAFGLYQNALNKWQYLGELDKVALVQWYLGACNEMTLSLADALKHYGEALAMIDRVGDMSVLRGRVLIRLGTVLTKQEHIGRAAKSINEGLRYLEGRVSVSDYSYAQQKLAVIQLNQGNIDQAHYIIEDSVRMIPKSDKFRLTQAKVLTADLLFRSGESSAALVVAAEAESLATEYGFSHQLLALSSLLSRHTATAVSLGEINNTPLTKITFERRFWPVMLAKSSMEKVTANQMIIDFAVVTALEKEAKALITRLENHAIQRFERQDIRTYHLGNVTVNDSEHRYNLAAVILPSMGNVSAANAVTDIINIWNPRYILLIGIAGGIAQDDLDLGDVVVADQVVGYDYGKVTDTDTKLRDRVYPTSSLLLDRVRNFWDMNWVKEINVPRPKGSSRDSPKLFVGTIASGDRVIASEAFQQQLKARWSKLAAIEMEGEGVLAATFDRPHRTPVMVIRGISDMANANKSDDWQEYAANAAASFVIGFLKSGPVEVSTPN